MAQRIAAMRVQRGTPIRAVMLDRLGPNVWHRTPAEASAVLEELEETARLWLLSRPQGRAAGRCRRSRPCDSAFGARW